MAILIAGPRSGEGVQLTLRGEAFFTSGDAHLFLGMHPVLASIGREMEKTPYKVRIEGHTDNVPIQTEKFPSNWELSGARASAVARFFEEQGLEPWDRP